MINRKIRGEKLGETKDGKGKYEYSISEIKEKLFGVEPVANARGLEKVSINDYSAILSGINQTL